MSQSTDTAALFFVIPDPWANYSVSSIGTFSRRQQAIIQRRQDPLELGEYGCLRPCGKRTLFVSICTECIMEDESRESRRTAYVSSIQSH
jgi:hypothetical protein